MRHALSNEDKTCSLKNEQIYRKRTKMKRLVKIMRLGMSWIRTFGMFELVLILIISSYSFASGIREESFGVLILTLILLRLEILYLKVTRGVLTVASFFSVWYYMFHHLGFSISSKSVDAKIFFILVPIVFLILIFNYHAIRSSLVTFLLLTASFGGYGDSFWRLYNGSSNGLEIERKADENHKPCPHVNHPYLGYRRLENCKDHKIEYWLEGKNLTTYQINTNGRGDRLVPGSNPKSDNVAFFIGGSRTFGDGVADDETYPFYLTKSLNLKSQIWANSAWGLNQVAFLVQDRWDELKVSSENGSVTVFYHAISSHITRTSGAYYETLRYHHNYPKYSIKDEELEYLGSLRSYSLSKVIAYSWVWNFCRLECRRTFKFGASTSDYLNHLDFIAAKVAAANAQLVIVIHPGRYGAELKNEVDLSDHFALNSNVTVLDATDLFPLKSPYVIHEVLDNHLSSKGNKLLAQFISNNLDFYQN